MLRLSALKVSVLRTTALIAAIWLNCIPTAHSQDPGTIYLEAYLQVEDAEKLEQSGNFSEALRKFNDAKIILDNIARDHRGWRPEVLNYRRRKVNEAIGRCRKNLPDERRTNEVPGIPNKPPTNGTNQASLLERREAAIKQLELSQKKLQENLQRTQLDYKKAVKDLQTSQGAQAGLMNELKVAREKLDSEKLDSEDAKKLKTEIAHLQNDLALVNESFLKAEKRNTELEQEIIKVKSSTDSIEAQRAELKVERTRIEELLNGVSDNDVKKLLAENLTLKKQLSEARTEVQRLSSEKERDAEQIASLRNRIKGVEERLATIQQENSQYQERITDLSSKLKITENNLAEALKSPKGKDSIAQAALLENKTLRGIVKRQIMQQAWRKQAKELVLEELTRQGVASRGLINQIEKLAGTGTVLTAQEQELLKESLLGDLGKKSGLILVQGDPQKPITYPELSQNNEGQLSKVGLNENLTQYAAAIAFDFAKENYKECTKNYEKILQIVPDNVYTLRNLGIVKMRLGQNQEAETLFKKSIQIEPDNGYSHFILGVYYYRIGLDDLAIKSIDEGLKKSPENAKAHHYLGAICIKQGLRERAIKEFESVITIDPNFGDAYYNLAYLYATEDPKRLDLARECYLRAQQNGTSADEAMDQALGS